MSDLISTVPVRLQIRCCAGSSLCLYRDFCPKVVVFSSTQPCDVQTHQDPTDFVSAMMYKDCRKNTNRFACCL